MITQVLHSWTCIRPVALLWSACHIIMSTCVDGDEAFLTLWFTGFLSYLSHTNTPIFRLACSSSCRHLHIIAWKTKAHTSELLVSEKQCRMHLSHHPFKLSLLSLFRLSFLANCFLTFGIMDIQHPLPQSPSLCLPNFYWCSVCMGGTDRELLMGQGGPLLLLLNMPCLYIM